MERAVGADRIDRTDDREHDMMWGNYGSNFGWWVMGTFMVVTLTALVLVGVWLLTRRRVAMVGSPVSTADGRANPNPAQSILDERYARGELTTAEYRERVTNIGL